MNTAGQQLYFASFTIEGDFSASLMRKAQKYLFDWVLNKKEVSDFHHFQANSSPDDFPDFERFCTNTTWNYEGPLPSEIQTVAGLLRGGRHGWGVRYRHSDTRQAQPNYDTFFSVECLLVDSGEKSIVTSISVQYFGPSKLSKCAPAFASVLLGIGSRCYNSKSVPREFVDLVQFSYPLPNAKPINGDSINPFLASPARRLPVVAVPARDLETVNPKLRKEIVDQFVRCAKNAAGLALFFILDGQYSGIRMNSPGEPLMRGKRFPLKKRTGIASRIGSWRRMFRKRCWKQAPIHPLRSSPKRLRCGKVPKRPIRPIHW